MNKAIGLIEVVGLTNAIVAADECVKAASVNLLGIEKVSGGIVTVKIIGDVSAVMAAVESGRAKVEHSGTFRGSHVIPRLQEEVLSILVDKDEAKEESCNTEEVQKVEEAQVIEIIKECEVAENIKVADDNLNSVEVENANIIEESTKDKTTEVLQVNVEAKEDKLTEDELSKRTVKELRQMAISLKLVKTWKEAKELKKEDLILKILSK